MNCKKCKNWFVVPMYGQNCGLCKNDIMYQKGLYLDGGLITKGDFGCVFHQQKYNFATRLVLLIRKLLK